MQSYYNYTQYVCAQIEANLMPSTFTIWYAHELELQSEAA